MLQQLSISNFVIIDRLTLSFGEGLNVITGETGAGKSIVLEALLLALGERGDTAVLRNPEQKCVVEAQFTELSDDALHLLQQADVDATEPLLLRRELLPQGRSRFFVNDTPVPASLLRQLAALLIDLHRQHDNQELGGQAFQLSVADSLAGQQQQVRHFRQAYWNYRRNLEKLQQWQKQPDTDYDYLSFQLEELRAARLNDDELARLEEEQQRLANAEQILATLAQSVQALREADDALLSRLHALRQALRSVASSWAPVQQELQRLDAAHAELSDIAGQLHRLSDALQPDPQRLQQVTERLDLIYRLLQKHRLKSVAELVQRSQQLEQQLGKLHAEREQLARLQQTVAEQHDQLLQQAELLSQQRLQQLDAIVRQINRMLPEVGMPQAQIRVTHERLPQGAINAYGIDRISFLFAPNSGSAFQENSRVASGGELSRLMLCFKSLIARETALPTLIFDEIDAGISGETAVKVARLMRKLAGNHQVICITHLPQLAAKGHRHFQVVKEEVDGRTLARIHELRGEEKIRTIAHMIAGQNVTPAALASARELLQ